VRDASLKTAESNGRIIDTSFDVRRLDTNVVDSTWQPSRSTEINRTLPYSTTSETLNSSIKIEPIRMEMRRLDANTNQPLESSTRLVKSISEHMYENKPKSNSSLMTDKEPTPPNEFEMLRKKVEEGHQQTFQSPMLNQD
jgi:hypothetical protein